MLNGYDSALILSLSCTLLMFGIAYNFIVSWLEENGYLEGFVSLAVAIGVGVTAAVMAAIDWRAAVLMLWLFLCSGAAMVIGSIWRYVKKRKAGQDASDRCGKRCWSCIICGNGGWRRGRELQGS